MRSKIASADSADDARAGAGADEGAGTGAGAGEGAGAGAVAFFWRVFLGISLPCLRNSALRRRVSKAFTRHLAR